MSERFGSAVSSILCSLYCSCSHLLCCSLSITFTCGGLSISGRCLCISPLCKSMTTTRLGREREGERVLTRPLRLQTFLNDHNRLVNQTKRHRKANTKMGAARGLHQTGGICPQRRTTTGGGGTQRWMLHGTRVVVAVLPPCDRGREGGP